MSVHCDEGMHSRRIRLTTRWSGRRKRAPSCSKYQYCAAQLAAVRFDMNREEKITEKYLKSLGYKDVVFEPDGNIPPNFLIEDRIAVEVRRLNQHFFTEDELRALEEGRIPLFKLLKSSFSEFDAQYKGSSYWVSIRFGRPIECAKTVRKAISKSLTDFLGNLAPLPCKVNVIEGMYFHIYPSKPVEGRVFRFAGGTDRERGGFVLSEFKRNFDHCMKEKSEKINDQHAKYNSW
ncbi:hypothetical protein ES703_12404 [subsurface metagenome]